MTDPTKIDRTRLKKILRDTFGHREFRPGQEPVVSHVASGRDALVVMPTGAGKSLCYQLPALYRPGVAVIISPLIALMKDQVDALTELGIKATFINSSISVSERDQRMAAVIAGDIPIVYVAPERFRSTATLRQLSRAEIGLFVVDEAHCLSEWGHDFRPDYLRLGEVRRALGCPPTVAATATATSTVRADIVSTLDLDEPGIFVTGFDRANLALEVIPARSRAHKEDLLGEELRRMGRPALVYCATRKSVDKVQNQLRKTGERVAGYHAGLLSEQRTRIQDDFMEGRLSVVAATNAFGMGIDKEDIRGVIHFDLPRSIEAYYQEIGRAGRDGLPAHIALLYRVGDRGIQEFFIDNSHPPEWAVISTWEALESAGTPTVFRSRRALADALGNGATERMVGASMVVLEREGWIRRLPVREGLAEISFVSEDPERVPSREGLPRSLWKALCSLRQAGGHPVERSGTRPDGPRVTDEFWASIEAEAPTEPLSSSPLQTRHIPVHLPSLAEELGVPRSRLTGAMRRLEERALIEVEHADRCSGARLLRRGQDFDLDFAPLRRRRHHEIDKLDRMTAYAEDERCRREAILHYFGEETSGEPCGNCDVCLAAGGEAGPEPEALAPEHEEIVRKALACVARMGNGHSAGMVAKVLKGSAAKNLKAMGFDRLSTFGLLPTLTHDEIGAVLAALVRKGCLVETGVTRSVRGFDRHYKVLNMAELGSRVMRQQEDEFKMVFPKVGRAARARSSAQRAARRAVGGGHQPVLDTTERSVFEKLREVRSALAEGEGVPPYAMGTNRLLRAIAQSMPEDRRAMLELPGCGERMFDKAGVHYLQVVQAFAPDDPSE